jgi:hypothetical protein
MNTHVICYHLLCVNPPLSEHLLHPFWHTILVYKALWSSCLNSVSHFRLLPSWPNIHLLGVQAIISESTMAAAVIE